MDHFIFIGPLCTTPKDNQSFTNKLIAKHKSLKEPPIYFIDGGGAFKEIIVSVTSFHIGDGDSSKELGSEFPIIGLNKEKDESDLVHGLRHYYKGISDKEPLTQLHFYGFIGGELSHQLAVFGDSSSMIRQNEAFIFYDHEAIKKAELFRGTRNFKKKGLFSLFTFSSQKISISGEVAYQTNKKDFTPFSSLGLHNLSEGPFSIESNEPTLIIWD